MYNMVMYYYVLIVFSLRRESLKLILATDSFRDGSVTCELGNYVEQLLTCARLPWPSFQAVYAVASELAREVRALIYVEGARLKTRRDAHQINQAV
jgi:hypothetical protein